MTVSVTFYSSADFSNTTADVTGVNWAAGDAIICWSGGDDTDALDLPTATGLTFVSQQTEGEGTGLESATRMSIAIATGSGSSQTISVGGAAFAAGSAVWVLTGSAGETFAAGVSQSSLAESLQSLNCTADSWVFYAHGDSNASANNLTAATGSGTPTRDLFGQEVGDWGYWAGHWATVDAGSNTYGPSAFTGVRASQISLEVTVTVAASSEQEGFRWRTDSGTESNPTWEAAQDTNITGQATGETIGLRVLIDYTGDPDDEAPKLQYRKSAGTWFDVEVP